MFDDKFNGSFNHIDQSYELRDQEPNHNPIWIKYIKFEKILRCNIRRKKC